TSSSTKASSRRSSASRTKSRKWPWARNAAWPSRITRTSAPATSSNASASRRCSAPSDRLGYHLQERARPWLRLFRLALLASLKEDRNAGSPPDLSARLPPCLRRGGGAAPPAVQPGPEPARPIGDLRVDVRRRHACRGH